MLRLEFDVEDLATLRFGISPLAETVGALRLLGDPAPPRTYAPWLERARCVRVDEPLRLALDLLAPSGYVPDFLTPPPDRTPVAELADELSALASTEADEVRQQLLMLTAGEPAGLRVEALHRDPPGQLAVLSGALARFHAEAIAPVWDRVLTVLTSEVADRARRLAAQGPGGVLGDLHPGVRWASGCLTADLRFDARFALEGRGLLLMPSVFWRAPGPIVLDARRPALIYPARGLELTWAPAPEVRADLAAVLGHTRARLLEQLDDPVTTTELARRLGLAAPGVSQHLQRLRRAGLAVSVRTGREVRYARTPTADQLLETARPPG